MKSWEEINNLTAVTAEEHDRCLSIVENDISIEGIETQVRIHGLKFDGNGQPMVKALAELLYDYIIHYCIASKNRKEPLTPQKSARLVKEARELFRHPKITDESPDKTGEAGELLLYFLMESILGAPQMVSKMELKTNHKDEVKGSDGIHARYNSESELVEFFFGESKLYKSVTSAISSAISSIETFHEKSIQQHEFCLVTKHFKFADEETKNAIKDLLVGGEPGPNVCVKHACLIGYDYKNYASLKGTTPFELTKDFLVTLKKEESRLAKSLQKNLDGCTKKHLKFEVFFVPFPSVVEFRNAFNEALD